MEPSAERLVEFPMVIFAFAIKWLEKQVDPDLASKKSGWSLLNEKFDELLSFVQLIAKRNTDDENQRKEDDKDTSEAEPEGHSNTNATPPRPPTPPKPEGKDSQLDSKIDSLEEKIRLIQGLNSFGNTDFSSMSWFPNMTVPPKFKAPEFEKYNGRGDPMIHLQMYCRKMAPYADNEPLLIQTFQDTLTGNAAEWYSQLKKISHWKELADTFLAQYGFNSQIAPDRFDLQEDGKEEQRRPSGNMPKDLIPVGDRIEDALKTKKIVDMTALMALAEQAAKKAPTKRKEGDVQMIGRNNGRPRQVLPTFTMQPIQPRPIQAPAPTQAPAPAPAPQMPARPEGNQPNDNSGPQRRDFNPNSACDFHFGEVGHTVENCGQLRHRVQDLIDHGVLKFEGLPNITTNPLPKHPEGGVNMVEVEEGNEESIAWRRLFYTLEKQKHITPLDAPPGPSTGDSCEYHSGARGHSLDCCEEFKKKVTDLMENGIVGREEIPSKGSRQPDDPSEFDWYAEINLDDIVEDEMDLDNLQDEEADWGYFMEDDTDEWRDVDFTEFFQFPCLIVPPGFVTPEFEIFYEDGDPELRNLTGWDDLVRVFLERYRFNPHSILEYLGLKKDEEPYIIPDPGVGEVIVEIKEEPSVLSLPALTEGEEGEEPSQGHHHQTSSPPLLLKKKTLALWLKGLSIHTIAEEEDSTTTPPTRHCQQGEEVKTWTCVPLLQRVSSSNEITRKTSNDPHVSKIDNKTDCSLDNIDNSDEEIELPKPREVKIGTRCAAEQKEALIALLREFHEIFAWSYQDMPGLDTDIVVHKIPLKPECKPVKQALRRMKPEVILKIKEEVEKQLKAGFLSTVTYSDWVANIVPVPKKDGKVRMCVDYRDLNRASPKDNFPLPHIDTLVDNTATNVVFSFMDGFSGYNQIKMAEEDKSKTAFVTHWGTFVYDVMPFGLKNAGATYQRAMVTLFHDMIHHEIEVYVDDMIAKSRTAQDHLTDLRKLFQRLKNGRGIEIDPAKVQAIRSMPAPKDRERDPKLLGKNQLYSSLHRTAYGNLRASVQVAKKRCEDKDVPSFYTSQSKKHPWAACWDNKTRLGRKEQAIYYLSKKFTEPETRYLLVEEDVLRTGLGLQEAETVHALLHHLVGIPDGPDQITRPEQLELMDSEFPDEDVMTVDEDNQGRWKLYFDGAANAVGSGIGAVLVSPKGQQTPIAVKLGFDCTNNMTEYEACIVGLQAALEFGAYELEVFGDSLLIVSQTNGEWQASGSQAHPVSTIHQPAKSQSSSMSPSHTPQELTITLLMRFATLASLIKLVEGDDVRPLRIETRDIPAYCVCIEECMNVEAEIDDKPWYYDIKRFIQDREYPSRATENEKKYIRRMAFQFFLSGEILYKRTHDATLLRCVDAEEANRLIPRDARGINGSPCQRTLPGPEDHESWLLLVDNGEGLHQTCPDASNGHEFILVAIDYFTKWVEACSFKNVTQVAVTRFVKNNIICRYGMPEMLITDNASNLNNRMMDQLCQQFKIQHHNSAPYRPKMNGAVEAANKNVKKILSKMTETYKDWHEHLPYALCAYRTSVRTSVGATPYSLVYGMEAVLPVEVEIPSLRILSQTQLEEAEWAQATLYQRRIERAYNKKARPRTFQPGDLVLKKRNMALSDPRGKFAPSYEGPYVVKKAFSGGAIILADMDGEEFRSPINSDSVIKYHV
uniref:Uncharacterized protein n=1 Tax=Fagus sylvatica TaxID=28930 RepID=A0A2N9FC45_FAGSY